MKLIDIINKQQEQIDELRRANLILIAIEILNFTALIYILNKL